MTKQATTATPPSGRDAATTRSVRPRVVIVGGGFGGLTAAKALAREAVDIVLLDRSNHHCFQPLLYQVATAALSPADVAWPIRGVLSRQANVTVLLLTVRGVDLARRLVITNEKPEPYDVLILATGATHSYFGHDDWSSVAPGLKSIEDATVIRRRLPLAFERAELSDSADERSRFLTFVIVGGGPTGVEMAGAVAEVARHALRRDFRRIDPRTARIVLVEAGPRILPALPEDLSRYAHATLEKMGVEILTNTKVVGCDRDGVDVGERRIAASTIVWAAGVVASDAAAWIEAAHDRVGRVLVAPDLSAPGHPDIFVIGDTAAVASGGGMAPGIAPAAKQMGAYVAKVVAARIAGGPAPASFVYRHEGDLATIGRKAAVVSIRGFRLKGLPGWLFWSLIHVYFLIGLRHRLSVALAWLWSYFSLQRGARLITGDVADDAERSVEERRRGRLDW